MKRKPSFYIESSDYFSSPFFTIKLSFDCWKLLSDITSEKFTWQRYFERKTFNKSCPKLACFGQHIPFSHLWADRVKGLFVEFSVMSNNKFWYYKIEETYGYYLKLSALGNPSCVVWINIICPHYRGFSYLDQQKRRNSKIQPPFAADSAQVERLIMSMHGLFHSNYLLIVITYI